jgi:hypothetical protein
MQYSEKQQQLIQRLFEIAQELQGQSSLSNSPDPFRALIFVEGEGLFISRDWAYGVVDIDMELLEMRFPGKVVYKLGVAEMMQPKERR